MRTYRAKRKLGIAAGLIVPPERKNKQQKAVTANEIPVIIPIINNLLVQTFAPPVNAVNAIKEESDSENEEN